MADWEGAEDCSSLDIQTLEEQVMVAKCLISCAVANTESLTGAVNLNLLLQYLFVFSLISSPEFQIRGIGKIGNMS